MILEMLASSTSELWFMSALLLIGAGFILFTRVEFMFLGMIITIAYDHHRAHMDELFTIKKFNDGKALECGLWRGESVIVDPSKGWSIKKDIGLIKNDVIIKDIGVCHVISEKSPKPSQIPYWMVYLSLMVMLMILRLPLYSKSKQWLNDCKEEKKDEDAIFNKPLKSMQKILIWMFGVKLLMEEN